MVQIDVFYEGQLTCQARHEPSGTTLSTDAPVDNHGLGRTFSPTDLLATALGTCMCTVMGMLARKQGSAIEGMTVRVNKIMTTTGPRRVARLEARLQMPKTTATLDDESRKALEHAANTCPVRLSLLDAIEVPLEFVWPSA